MSLVNAIHRAVTPIPPAPEVAPVPPAPPKPPATSRQMEQNGTDCSASKITTRQLRDLQLQAVSLLLTGMTDTEVAEKLHLSRTTLWRWHAEPLFQEELGRRRREIHAASADRLRALVQPAIQILESQMSDPKTALRAAAILLRLAAPKRLTPASVRQLEKESFDQLLNDHFSLNPLELDTPDPVPIDSE